MERQWWLLDLCGGHGVWSVDTVMVVGAIIKVHMIVFMVSSVAMKVQEPVDQEVIVATLQSDIHTWVLWCKNENFGCVLSDGAC